MDTNLKWLDLDSFDTDDRQKITNSISHFIKNHPDAGMDHNLDWLTTKCGPGKSVKVFVNLAQDGSINGYAPFFVHPSALSFSLFGIALFDYRVNRYAITAQPLLANNQSSPETLFESLFCEMHRILNSRDVLFGLGVALESSFGRFMIDNKALSKKYLVLPYGDAYQRRTIRLPEDLEKYISGLGYSTRYEVRRAIRKLNKQATVAYRVYTRPEDVAELVRLLHSISVKTYQHQLLNLGISEDEETYRNLSFAAEKGWLRSLILFCDDKPVAFEHGFFYHNVYYLTHMGYDPDWSKSSVGTIAHIYTVEHLIQRGAIQFDFLYGDNGSKKRLSNESHQEQNFYLVPRVFPLSTIAYALRLFNTTTGRVGQFLEKYGIKSKLRRFLRRKTTQS